MIGSFMDFLLSKEGYTVGCGCCDCKEVEDQLRNLVTVSDRADLAPSPMTPEQLVARWLADVPRVYPQQNMIAGKPLTAAILEADAIATIARHLAPVDDLLKRLQAADEKARAALTDGGSNAGKSCPKGAELYGPDCCGGYCNMTDGGTPK